MPKKINLTRLEANREIILLLEDFLERNPDLRFVQALHALRIIDGNKDKFYEESKETLKIVEASQSNNSVVERGIIKQL